MSTLTLAQQLSTLLSNTFVFSQQLHGFHWLLRGRGFNSMHPFLGEDYSNVYASVDTYAEQILTLEFEPPVQLSEYLVLSTSIREIPRISEYEKILHIAYSSHQIIGNLIKGVYKTAEDCDAFDISNYLGERQGYHFKQAYFYRAELGIPVPSIFEASKPKLQTAPQIQS